MNKRIMVSIVVPTYNHEKYITKALDSILMQETQYYYEVLVGEDASTDNTRKVLEEYERLHPGRITVFYREKNLCKEKYSNAADLRRRTVGKYFITLEGDDYWTDKYKLEEEVSFLESHPEYVAVAHNCVVVDENNHPNGEKYPECKDEEYTLEHFLIGVMPGQLTTLLCRNFMTQELFDNTILEKHLTPGDKITYFALASVGRIYCIQKQMSAYRHVRKTGSSYSANYKYNFETDEVWYKQMLSFTDGLNNKKALKYMEALYFGCLMHAYKSKKLKLRDMLQYMKNLKHKFSAIRLFCVRMWKIKVSKKGFSN